MLAFNDLLEAAHSVGDFDVATGDAGELLRDVKGLLEELLHLARARNSQLVLF